MPSMLFFMQTLSPITKGHSLLVIHAQINLNRRVKCPRENKIEIARRPIHYYPFAVQFKSFDAHKVFHRIAILPAARKRDILEPVKALQKNFLSINRPNGFLLSRQLSLTLCHRHSTTSREAGQGGALCFLAVGDGAECASALGPATHQKRNKHEQQASHFKAGSGGCAARKRKKKTLGAQVRLKRETRSSLTGNEA